MDDEDGGATLFGDGPLSHYTGICRHLGAANLDAVEARPVPSLGPLPELGAILDCPLNFSARWAEAQRQAERFQDVTTRFVDTPRVYRGPICPQILPGWFFRAWRGEWVRSLFRLSTHSFPSADDCFACIEAVTRHAYDIDGLVWSPLIAPRWMNPHRIDRVFRELTFLARPGRFTEDEIEYLAQLHEGQAIVGDDEPIDPDAMRENILAHLWATMLLLDGTAPIPDRPQRPQSFTDGLCRVRNWLNASGYRKTSTPAQDSAGESPGETGRASTKREAPANPDGPDGGRWVWWRGERHTVPAGVIYRLISFMWNRDAAGYDSLMNGSVFDDSVAPQTVRSRVCDANKALRPIGIPWRLSADSEARTVVKATIENPPRIRKDGFKHQL